MNQPYILVDSSETLERFEADLEKSNTISLDLETYGLDFLVDKIRLVQVEANDNIYLINMEESGSSKSWMWMLVSAIENSGTTVVGHNIKFDMKFIYRDTAILLTHIWDTQIAQMVLTAGKYPRQKYFSLSELVEDCCDVILDKEVRMDFVESEVITEEMILYAISDVKYLKQIYEYQLAEMKQLEMTVVAELEMRLAPVVCMMEYNGILLDWDAWMELANKAEKKVEELRPQIINEIIDRSWETAKNHITDGKSAYEVYDMPLPKAMKSKTGKTDLTLLESLTSETFIKKQVKAEFNISSHFQLRKALQLCGVNINGVLIQNTQAGTLEQVKNDELIDKLLEYKTYYKKHTTYGESWKEYIHPKTGRIHPQFNQVGTVTGRWSSDSPNMQNVPAEPEYRACFIAREGYKLITADYSQAELRFVGAVSGEQIIIDAYRNNEDIHTRTAMNLFDKIMEKVTKRERSEGKTLNFSILYGSTPFGISEKNPDIPESRAYILVDKFFAGYPSLHSYIKKQGALVWKEKMSKTPLGRIRFFPVDETRLYTEKELRRIMGATKREGVNHVIQGGSADSLKIAMVNAFYNSPFQYGEFSFQLQIHDEVVVEVLEEVLDDGIEYLVGCMETAEQVFLGEIPAKADYVVADHWVKG